MVITYDSDLSSGEAKCVFQPTHHQAKVISAAFCCLFSGLSLASAIGYSVNAYEGNRLTGYICFGITGCFAIAFMVIVFKILRMKPATTYEPISS